MRIGVIGAGVAGMSAALDLAKAGHQVTIFEAGSVAGGLAAGFKTDYWDWHLEKFYHHWFETDDDIINLIHEIGHGDKLFFPTSITSLYYRNRVLPFGTPVQMLRFLLTRLGVIPTLRFGLAGLYLRQTQNWQALEKETAHAWLNRTMGRKAYEIIWEPLLVGKFGRHYQKVNMAWMWARIHKRSFRLGYFEGGFQAFCEALLDYIQNLGVDVRFETAISCVEPQSDQHLLVNTANGSYTFDRVIATTSPGLLARLTPKLPPDYLTQLKSLTSMGAVVLVLALKHPLTDQHYWINLPKQEDFPFLALVEHTNFIDPSHYGGDHIVYCGDYLDPDHPYFSMEKEELLETFLPTLSRFNADFSPDWVKNSWLFKAPYAQPVPHVNHSQNIPPLETPIPGLFWASMSQVYPWDRGTNYAVEIGRRVAAAAIHQS